MAGAHLVPKFTARRPDWELPELHIGLQLAPLDPLYNNRERIKCPNCGRSRVHYCYDCLQPLIPFPRVELPFRVSVVTHHEEKASKNTGVQLALLAPGQVDLHSMSQVPGDVDPSRSVLLFPGEAALEVEQLQPDSVDRVFIIDSRWKKAAMLVRTETFRSMRAVRLSHTRSAFWRFHTRGVAEEGVCTVEALYFFVGALAKQGKLSDPRFTAPHAFDNLLWYFVYQHQVVQQAAQKRVQERGAGGAQGLEDTEQVQEQAAAAQPQQQRQWKGQTKQQQQQQRMRQTQRQQLKKKQQQQRKQEPEQGQGPTDMGGTLSGAEVRGVPDDGSASTLAATELAGNGGEDQQQQEQQQQQQQPPHGDLPEDSRWRLHTADVVVVVAAADVADPARIESEGGAGGGMVREGDGWQREGPEESGPSGTGTEAAGAAGWGEAGLLLAEPSGAAPAATGSATGQGVRNDGCGVDGDGGEDVEGHRAKRARA